LHIISIHEINLEASVMAREHEESFPADVALLAPLAADYHILAELERDDLGTVFLAEQLRVGARRIALRVLPSAGEWDPERLAGFEQQVAAVARLRHPSVPVVYECGKLPDGTAYLAMELGEGETLGARLKRTGPPPAAELLAIVAQCAEALDRGHRAGIEHRQLSADRILLVAGLDATPDVKLKDFGLANGDDIHASGRERSESFGADRLDRPDILSLALVTKAMLTGQWPGVNEADVAEAAPLPPIPAPLQTVLGRALDATGGYSTAGEFAHAIQQAITPPASTPPVRPEPDVPPAPASRAAGQVPSPVERHGLFGHQLDEAKPSTPPPPWRRRRSVEGAPPAVAASTPARPEVGPPSDGPLMATSDQAEAEEERITCAATSDPRGEPAQGGPTSSMGEEPSDLSVAAGIPAPAGEPVACGVNDGPTGTKAVSVAPGAAEELAELRTRYAALQTEREASLQGLVELQARMARLQNEHQRMRETLEAVQQLVQRGTPASKEPVAGC
jgi:eukaryotic-like serine/threonine-protein kinase